MRNVDREVTALLKKYGTDYKRALKENRRLDYLYALGILRENLLEWYPFRAEGTLLQAGADFGALTGLFASKVKQVTVLDESEESLGVVRLRMKDREHTNIRYVRGNLGEYAKSLEENRKVPEAHMEHAEGEERYTYVTLIGGLEDTKEKRAKQIETAKGLLAPGGKLILAACNRFGMKYWAGAKRETGCVTKNELAALLPGGAFYYPMPDYRLPSAVYSEHYLPKKGDLTKDLALYDYPQYLLLDVGAAYDAVCEDGQFGNFANSFLVIWEKGEEA